MDPQRVLILAPHPDDEIVACGIAASRARSAGVHVFSLFLTTGVPPREMLWPWQRSGYTAWVKRRQDEALKAAALSGIEPVGFLETPSRCLRHRLDDAAVEIGRAIASSRAEALWVPAFEGAHQDHDTANALAAAFRNRLPVIEFAAYNFAGGTVQPNRFPGPSGRETIIALTAEEAARKQAMLACYRSERANLAHIRVTQESCRPLPAHDYSAPPHAGTLFRERFHWVPFRHPRVDFDPSAAIYDALGQWQAKRLTAHVAFADP
jgi:LmbE family N-acetylglucosaminyl deacetylase